MLHLCKILNVSSAKRPPVSRLPDGGFIPEKQCNLGFEKEILTINLERKNDMKSPMTPIWTIFWRKSVLLGNRAKLKVPNSQKLPHVSL